MKKLLVGLTFSMVCFSAYPMKPDVIYSVCGTRAAANAMNDARLLNCAGTRVLIEDHCSGGGITISYYMILEEDGDFSACSGNMPTLE
ncbi:hypothetical protein [Algoriphagus sp.]|uniref:hypothetical protein n=1 Tax=Algoriphagus sp. TaxID=1872435 RepID=UPI0032732743